MHPLPQPADLTSLVLRTDFRDNAAWAALETAIDGFLPGGTTYLDFAEFAYATDKSGTYRGLDAH